MTDRQIGTFEQWFETLLAVSAERGLCWAIDKTGAAYREAYEAGHSPEREIQIIADMAEWRGCGCGGT